MKTPSTRTRTRLNQSLTPLKATYVDERPNPDLVIVSNYTGTPNGTSESMIDTNTPDFNRIISNGGILNSPMSKSKKTYIYSKGTVNQVLTHPVVDAGKIHTQYDGFWSAVSDAFLRPYTDGTKHDLPSHALSTNREGILSSQAAVGARNKVNPILVQGVVTIAELHKTVRMVTRAARTFASLGKAITRTGNADQIFDLVTGVKRGNAGRAGQLLFGGASRYLEYRYGWRILAMEIQGVIKALNQVEQRARARRATARSSKSSFSSSETMKSLVWSDGAGTDTHKYTSTENLEARAYVLYEADLKYQPARDWGVYDLPLAAWELIPFSFVVDWFIPIGNWIEAITPKAGVKVIAEGVTVKTTRVVTREVVSWTPATSGTTRWSMSGQVGMTDTYVYESKVRTPTLSGALLRPYVDVKLNVARCLDAIALLATVGRGIGTNSLRR